MNKILFLILLSSSFSAYAEESVIMAMRSMFSKNLYQGVTPANEECVLEIFIGDSKALVGANGGTHLVYKVINDKTPFRYRSGRRELLSSDNSGTFRTLAIDDHQTYTVTARRNSDGSESTVECIINL